MLYIVSTPIGNMKDITKRAVDALQTVDLIASEDTRRTGALLKKLDIKAKMISFHDHNSRKRIPKLIGLLQDGTDIALVSDAGTPGISDPGFDLIRSSIEAGVKVSPVPGANAAISALVASGLPTDKFTFVGFLPKKKKKLIDALSIQGTIIAYESCHRIHKTLDLIAKHMPDAKLCIAREITKKFEEFLRGTAKEIIEDIKERKLKGEIVLVVQGYK